MNTAGDEMTTAGTPFHDRDRIVNITLQRDARQQLKISGLVRVTGAAA